MQEWQLGQAMRQPLTAYTIKQGRLPRIAVMRPMFGIRQSLHPCCCRRPWPVLTCRLLAAALSCCRYHTGYSGSKGVVRVCSRGWPGSCTKQPRAAVAAEPKLLTQRHGSSSTVVAGSSRPRQPYCTVQLGGVSRAGDCRGQAQLGCC